MCTQMLACIWIFKHGVFMVLTKIRKLNPVLEKKHARKF